MVVVTVWCLLRTRTENLVRRAQDQQKMALDARQKKSLLVATRKAIQSTFLKLLGSNFKVGDSEPWGIQRKVLQ